MRVRILVRAAPVTLLGVGALVASLLAGGTARAVDPAGVYLGLRLVAQGLASPVAMAVPAAFPGRIFVAEQAGRVRLVTSSGGVATTPYLDIADRVLDGGERGLLGITFSPYFQSNGHVYVAYTDVQGDLRVSRFVASPPSATSVSATTETVIMDITHRFASNHNGGQIAFGPDRYLYVGTGDGGGGGDPSGNAQNLGSPLGKILRVDITRRHEPYQYAIPGTNPFVGVRGARPEVFHYGLRNPWRFSFDRAYGGLFIGDVGQGSREEIDYVERSVRGANFGWDCREGTLNTATTYGGAYCANRVFRGPVREYVNGNGRCAVIGGYVYRGTRYQSFFGGVYLYADYCSGEIWGIARNSGRWSGATLKDLSSNITTFGEDAYGELYVADASGKLYRILVARK